MKKLFLLLFLGMFMFSLVSADSIGTYKVETPMQITNYCQIGTCTYMNLTSIEINGVVSNINTIMTKDGQNFNYSYTPYELGTYTFKTCGNPDGDYICDSDTFLVTPTGDSQDFTLFFILGFLLFAILTFYGIKIENEWVSLIGCFGLLIMGIYTSINGIGNFKNDITSVFSYVITAIGLGIGFEALRKITYY